MNIARLYEKSDKFPMKSGNVERRYHKKCVKWISTGKYSRHHEDSTLDSCKETYNAHDAIPGQGASVLRNNSLMDSRCCRCDKLYSLECAQRRHLATTVDSFYIFLLFVFSSLDVSKNFTFQKKLRLYSEKEPNWIFFTNGMRVWNICADGE